MLHSSHKETQSISKEVLLLHHGIQAICMHTYSICTCGGFLVTCTGQTQVEYGRSVVELLCGYRVIGHLSVECVGVSKVSSNGCGWIKACSVSDQDGRVDNQVESMVTRDGWYALGTAALSEATQMPLSCMHGVKNITYMKEKSMKSCCLAKWAVQPQPLVYVCTLQNLVGTWFT